MTIEEAKQALKNGKAISHKYFDDAKYIRYNDKKELIDESGLILDEVDFWRFRNNIIFMDDWFIKF